MRLKISLGFLVLILALAVAFEVMAVGIKVTPSDIKAEVGLGLSIQKELTVENPAGDVALYEVYPDDFADRLRFKPASFILESKEKKKVLMEIEGKEQGVFSTTISLLAKPLQESPFKTSSGVKVPLTVEVLKAAEKDRELKAHIGGVLNQQIPAKHLMIMILVSVSLFALVLFSLWLRNNQKLGLKKEKKMLK